MTDFQNMLALWPRPAAFVAELSAATGAPRNTVWKWVSQHRAPPLKFAPEIARAAASRGGPAWTTEKVVAAIRGRRATERNVQNVTP